MSDIKNKIVDYLNNHPHLQIATVGPDGKPWIGTVGYVNEGAVVYFITDKTSRKARNILQNPQVAYTVDEDYEVWSEIQGIQMEGKATLVESPEEMQRLMGLFMQKYPQAASLPPNPNFVFIKVEPQVGYFIDDTIEHGHRDKVDFSA
ncbi:MAG: hypothetical protein Kow0037_29630 [Calditrichia bacterium]